MIEIIYDEAMMAYVRTRLYEWAEYYLPHAESIHYSSQTMKRHLLREGVLIQKGNDNDRAMSGQNASSEIEAYMSEMALQHPDVAKALRCYYATTSLKAKELELKKQGLNLTPAMFKHYIDLGHFWLAGRLTPKTASQNGHLLAA